MSDQDHGGGTGTDGTPGPDDPGRPGTHGRLRVLLAVALAAVLLLGAGLGTEISAPGLAHTLGLPNLVPVRPAPGPVDARESSLTTPLGEGPAPSPEGVSRALADKVGGLGLLTGVVLDPSTGQTLWSQGPEQPQTPASATKLLTTSAALFSLDPDTRFTTTVTAGPTPDSIVLVGGGDPTLSSQPGGNFLYPGAARLDDLVSAVRQSRAAAGAPPVRSVYLDLSRFQGPNMAPGWDPADVGSGNFSPISPVMMDGGRLDPSQLDGARSMTPGLDTAHELAARLGSPTAAVQEGTPGPGAPVLGQVHSAQLDELVHLALQNSDNVLAESLGREVARQGGAPPTFEGATATVTRVLAEHGIDVSTVALSDTSGLSPNDKIPASTLAAILTPATAKRTDDPRTLTLRPILDGLSVAGASGTLWNRFPVGSAESPGRGWVRAKTGTLTGTNSLAGEVPDADGHLLTFAFLSTGPDPIAARPLIDQVATTLRACGCR